MKKTNEGFGAFVVIVIVAVLAVGGVSYFVLGTKKAVPQPTQPQQNLPAQNIASETQTNKASEESKPDKPLAVTKKDTERPATKPVASPKPIVPKVESNVSPAAPAPAPPPVAPVSAYGKNSIGYIGCSVAQLGVQGYSQSAGNSGRFWLAYDTSGQSIDKWANANNSIWASFDAQVKNYGQPKAVWVLPCKLTATTNEVTQAIQNLKQHAPSAKIYMSPFSDVLPSDACPFANREHGDVDAALAGGLALTGPKLPALAMSELDPAIYYCDPNSAGSAKIGKTLGDFFDKF